MSRRLGGKEPPEVKGKEPPEVRGSTSLTYAMKPTVTHCIWTRSTFSLLSLPPKPFQTLQLVNAVLSREQDGRRRSF